MSDNDRPLPGAGSRQPEFSDPAPTPPEPVATDLDIEPDEFGDEESGLGPGWVPV